MEGRVRVEHPRHGRHYGTIVGPYSGDATTEPAHLVMIEGGYINAWTCLDAWLTPVPAGFRDMVIGDLLNLDMLKEVIEVEFLGTLWVEGDSGMLTPYVCEASFGDGFHLMTISTINQRPNYHVVRVCSSWRESSNRWYDTYRDDTIGERIDDVLTAIEEECGQRYFVDEDCVTCRPEGYECRCGDGEPWPAIETDGGCSWGHIRWDWLMKQLGITEQLERLRDSAHRDGMPQA
ncbi:hypothetical protein [Sphingomonas sp.]|uniref:hypothetical protein n=1 Tax=Sphingomonas sp. TaxID=28214 RepID=UPI00307EBCFE